MLVSRQDKTCFFCEGSIAVDLAMKVMKKTVEVQKGLDQLDTLMVTPRPWCV